MKARVVVLTGAFVCGGLVGAFAAERTVGQKGKAFSETEVAMRVNDILIIKNDDDVTHNVMSLTPGNEFNLGAQPPGVSIPITFDAAGEIKILCAIHPRMQLIVKVTK